MGKTNETSKDEATITELPEGFTEVVALTDYVLPETGPMKTGQVFVIPTNMVAGYELGQVIDSAPTTVAYWKTQPINQPPPGAEAA